MKRAIYIFAIPVLFAACTDGNQKKGNAENQAADTTLAAAIMDEPAEITYTQCPIAYLVDGELFFYSFEGRIKPTLFVQWEIDYSSRFQLGFLRF